MIRFINKFGVFCLLFIFSHTLFAETFHSFHEFQKFINQIVVQSIPVEPGETIETVVLQMNAQHQLPSCKTPFEASLDRPGLSSPAHTVLLSCPAEHSNVIYVPVQIKLMTPMVTAARRIGPGEVISEKDLLIQSYDKYQLYGDYFQDISEVSGFVTARAIAPGGVILKKSVTKPLYVKKNQPVTLIVKTGPIEVSMSGIAQMDGYLDSAIKVVNPSSKKVVDGIIVGPGKVEVR